MSYFSIRPQWEALTFSDSSLVLNNYYGRHLRLPTPPTFAHRVLDLLQEPRDYAEIVSVINGPLEKRQLDSFLKALLKGGVVKETDMPEKLTNHLPELSSDEFKKRFGPFLSWLAQYDTDSDPYRGIKAMQRLRNSTVTVIGAGGTGSFCVMMLAAAGVGHIRIVDGDGIESSNLVRQLFYTEEDVGTKLKADALAARAKALSSFTEISTVAKFIESTSDAENAVRDSDFVILSADAPRFILNRWVNSACCKQAIPYVNAFSGAVGPVYIPGKTACFSCLEQHLRDKAGDGYDEMVTALQIHRRRQYPSFVANVVRTAELQYFECIAYLTGLVEPRTLTGMLRFDPSGGSNVEFVDRDQGCGECGTI